MVESGKLPPMQERLPETPLVVELDGDGISTGQYGGTLQMRMGKAKDIRMMTVYGYARLIGFNDEYQLVPDFLEKFESEERRIFTLHLRKGHKWSDGHSFYLGGFPLLFRGHRQQQGSFGRAGLPQVLLSNGKAPKFEVIDEHTVRYTWEDPNPAFPLGLAGASPAYIYKPAHFMKRYHEKYADPDTLAKLIEEGSFRNWAAVHTPPWPPVQAGKSGNADPAALAEHDGRTVQTLRIQSQPVLPSGRPKRSAIALYRRGRVADVLCRSDSGKAGAGESDLQARYLSFDDYTFLKQGEEQQIYRVLT